MAPDYPAAHSMDTAFFAVDRDGHVAHFATGEGGALPFDASLEDPWAVMQRLGKLLPRTEVVFDLKAASRCEQKRAVLPRATSSGDARALPLLRPLAASNIVLKPVSSVMYRVVPRAPPRSERHATNSLLKRIGS